jgi:acetyl-CoA carboxylase beta subunit
MLNDYLKIKETAADKRTKLESDILKAIDSKDKETLNNDLVKINNDETNAIVQNEKKLANWAKTIPGTLNFLMRSRLKEIDLDILQDIYNSTQNTMSETAKKRMKTMLDEMKKALIARASKLEKMIAGEESEDDEKNIKDAEEKTNNAESDYDASGKIDAKEKIVKTQKQKKEDESPLNQI